MAESNLEQTHSRVPAFRRSLKRVQMHIDGYLCGNWVYKIQKAVSRLDYAPRLKEVQVTDFQKWLGNFTPKPDKPGSFVALKQALKKAGYTLASADIIVAGTLSKEGNGWVVIVKSSGQRLLEGATADDALKTSAAGDQVEITGDWKTVGIKARLRRRTVSVYLTGSHERGDTCNEKEECSRITYAGACPKREHGWRCNFNRDRQNQDRRNAPW